MQAFRAEIDLTKYPDLTDDEVEDICKAYGACMVGGGYTPSSPVEAIMGVLADGARLRSNPDYEWDADQEAEFDKLLGLLNKLSPSTEAI